MDVEVMNVEGEEEEEEEEETDQDDEEAESCEGEHNNADSPIHFHDDGTSEPYVGMVFESEGAAKTVYDQYARGLGFIPKADPTKMDGGIVYRDFVCGKEDSRRRCSDNCAAMLRIEMQGQNKWIVTKFVSEHSSLKPSPSKGHPCANVSSIRRNLPDTYQGELNDADNPIPVDGDGIFEPYVGMAFESDGSAKTFYDQYARRLDFSPKATQTKMDGGIVYREFVCGREGSRRCSDNCKAMLRIEMQGQNKWVVTKFLSEHSYPKANPSKGHPHKHFSSVGRSMPETYQGAGIFPRDMVHAVEGNCVSPGIFHGITSPAELNYDCYHGARSTLPAEQNHEGVCSIRNTPSAEVYHDASHVIKSPRPERSRKSNRRVRNAPPTDSHHIVRNSSAGCVSTNGNHVPVESNCGIKSTLAEPNRVMRGSVVANYPVKPSIHKRTLGRDAHNVLEYFKKMQADNPGFFYAIHLDEDNCMTNVFWADARSRIAYSHFGDAVTLDTRYRPHMYLVPFAAFTGVNHHGQTILFGCALLLDDSEASFIWLLKTFRTAMNDRHPTSLITDQDRSIKVAVSQVFPQVRHCLSKWHVFREGQERLGYLCNSNPNLQLDLYNCINSTETVEEFESAWESVLNRYGLKGNDWLHSLYCIRSQWVPAYFRDSFCAVLSPNQGFDGPFFDGFVNHHTTLPMFFRQYETALEKCFEKEIEADLDTIHTTPVLKTPSPMEKQAAELYTKKIFAKFQEELVETFVYTANRIEGDAAVSTFRVAKYEDVHNAYIVTFNYPELKASCSCKMFEYVGILCRHVLTVFTVTNVLQLPEHYILKRWTINAKTVTKLGEHGNESHGQESITSRFNKLCRDAIKYSEEGAITVETYDVAVSALREGGKKVSIMKKNIASIASPTRLVGGIGSDDKKTSAPNSETFPLLWPRVDEMTRRFNQNDAGAPALFPVSLLHGGMSLPRMAPISLQHDDGPLEKMVVLPCLKSMTWVMENKGSNQGKVAVINLKLQDYSRSGSAESEVKFNLTRHTLEPMLKSMAKISEQLSSPANKVAVINLKLQDTDTTSGESEVKFQVSRDTLSAMLRSMAYIREQISLSVDAQPEPAAKRHRK